MAATVNLSIISALCLALRFAAVGRKQIHATVPLCRLPFTKNLDEVKFALLAYDFLQLIDGAYHDRWFEDK